ncbi:VirK/YbjX family protein [Erwinia sp. HR93]|uniref:VirK/YbjX family protein n=1 Tax=Erwinia sp. HR93 TaxID=3094840 RepID=UPI002ADEE356|nr:VirK/YbjX family protein [Erwinia sp. HR93]MEA1064619.1 VirK/YbjX family protein [Erwinia sp. HR93]
MPYSILSPLQNCVPNSGWSLFQALSSGLYQPGPTWHKAAWRRKFMLRTLAMPLPTFRLLQRLTRLPHYDALLHAQPCLPCRLHRPWLAHRFSRRSAAAAILQHYTLLHQQLSAAAMLGYLSASGWTLAFIDGKNDARYQLTLRADCDLDKEGEATLTLYNAQKIALGQLTFTLFDFDGARTLFIGGLQGAKARISHQVIQDATKACHGLFPKRILLEAARQVAQQLGASRILAVGNRTHIYRSWRYRLSKKDKFHADYDAFWLESGAKLRHDDYFELLCHSPRRPLEAIPSKKRAEYRRRYALLDALSVQLDREFRAH